MRGWLGLFAFLACARDGGGRAGADAAVIHAADAAEAVHPPLVPVVVRPAGDRTLHHLDCALNRAGDGLAVWRETDIDFQSEVWASRLHQRWQPAEKLGTRPPTQIEGPTGTIDGEGRALAVWNESGGAEPGVIAARLLPATGWAAPARISTGWVLSLAGSAAGDAVAFGVVEGTPPTLLRYSPSAGWTPDTAVRLERDGFFFASALGRGLLAWNQRAGAGDELFTSDYHPGAGWTAPVRVQEARPFDHPLPIVNASVAPDGSAVLIWNRGGENQGTLWAVTRSAAGAWEAPHRLGEGDAALWTTTAVAVEGGGGLVVWETGESPERKVWAALHAPSGWQPAVTLGERSELTAGALDPSGSAVVAWATPGGIFGRHHTPARGWSATAPALDDNAGVASLCAAIDGGGRAWIVWIGQSPQVVNAAFLAE